MSKKVAVLVDYNYEELEVWYPLLRFREEGIETEAIGSEFENIYKSKTGYPCKCTLGIAGANVQDFCALVIPGGWAPDYLRRDKRIVDFVKNMFNAGKPVGAICHGPSLLCSAKILNGKKMTCFKSIKDDIENAGAIYEDAPVVEDGNLITSRVPTDLPFFCKAILKQIRDGPSLQNV